MTSPQHQFETTRSRSLGRFAPELLRSAGARSLRRWRAPRTPNCSRGRRSPPPGPFRRTAGIPSGPPQSCGGPPLEGHDDEPNRSTHQAEQEAAQGFALSNPDDRPAAAQRLRSAFWEGSGCRAVSSAPGWRAGRRLPSCEAAGDRRGYVVELAAGTDTDATRSLRKPDATASCSAGCGRSLSGVVNG